MPAQHGEEGGGEAEGDEDEAHAEEGGGQERGVVGRGDVLLLLCGGGWGGVIRGGQKRTVQGGKPIMYRT